jgi:hypothetical protein
MPIPIQWSLDTGETVSVPGDLVPLLYEVPSRVLLLHSN